MRKDEVTSETYIKESCIIIKISKSLDWCIQTNRSNDTDESKDVLSTESLHMSKITKYSNNW